MKKIVFTSAVLAALISFGSCQKEIDVIGEDSIKDKVTFTFTAEKAGETRTAAEEGESSVSYIWTSEDLTNTHLYLVTKNEEDKDVLSEVEDITVSKDSDSKKLSITATVDEAESYTFRAVVAGDMTTGGSPKVNTSQNPNGIINYDPNTDILVSSDLTATSPSDLLLSFERKVVINKMTIKGLTAGEKVDKVVLSSDKYLTGYYDGAKMSGQNREITINYSKLEVPKDGCFPVYFITMPSDGHTLTVKVFTETSTYFKTFGSGALNFTKGSFTRFGVNNLTSEVVSNLDGDYILANEAGSFIAKEYSSGNYLSSSGTFIEDEVIYYDPDDIDIDKAKITLSSVTIDGSILYTICQNNKYLYAAGTVDSDNKNQNYLKAAEAIPDSDNGGYYWRVSYVDGEWALVANRASYSNTLQMNTQNHNFTCYASANQTKVSLFKLDKFSPTPVIKANDFSLESDAITIPMNTGAVFNSNTALVTAAAYSDESLNSSSDWLSVSVEGTAEGTAVYYTATENATGNERAAYINIIAKNSLGRSVSKIIYVTQASKGGNYYLKVTEMPTSLDGTYVLVCESKNTVFTGAISTTSTAYGLSSSVTINDGKITQNLEEYELTLAYNEDFDNKGYSIKAKGKYLFWSSGNSLRAGTSISGQNNIWGIELDSNGVMMISNLSTSGNSIRYIKFNTDRFACYTNQNGYSGTTGAGVHLYRKVSAD